MIFVQFFVSCFHFLSLMSLETYSPDLNYPDKMIKTWILKHVFRKFGKDKKKRLVHTPTKF